MLFIRFIAKAGSVAKLKTQFTYDAAGKLAACAPRTYNRQLP